MPRRSSTEIAVKNADQGDKQVVAIFTGNSNTGSHTIRALLENYADKILVRAVVRPTHSRQNPNQAYVTSQFGDGVEVKIADVNNASQMEDVFKDVKVAFWATPDNTKKDRVQLTKQFVNECIKHRVDYPVIISMVGTSTDAANAPEHLKEFADIEEFLMEKRGTRTALVADSHTDTGKKLLQPIILRCGQFYQNFYGMARLFETGTFHFPLALGRMPAVSLKDIGECAAKILSKPSSYVSTPDRPAWNLIGTYLSGGDVARSFTMQSFGTKYDGTIQDEDAIQAFAAAHMDMQHAKRYIELLKYYRERWPGHDTDVLLEMDDIKTILGRKATPISAFAKSMVPLLQERDSNSVDPIVEAFKRGWITWSDSAWS